ncbi:uncharacterized protein V1518DRAFT_421402 [Limtongia smithiae]|uniref:uncharacterized protein n=1 Tax=Limtongia smithiae TaxID=1125753 RepID=UPI0034CDF55B
MSSDLFYSFLRVTTAQLLRSAGIDRCSPTVLDTLTDLAARYFALVATRAAGYAALCGRAEVAVSDVRMAVEDSGGLRPMRMLDDDGEEDEGLRRFMEWCATAPKEARTVAGAESLIEVLLQKPGNANQDDRFRGTILDPALLSHTAPAADASDSEDTSSDAIIISGGPGPELW